MNLKKNTRKIEIKNANTLFKAKSCFNDLKKCVFKKTEVNVVVKLAVKFYDTDEKSGEPGLRIIIIRSEKC